eukprot:15036034-Alexandrium_andersonii.AAC.1
MSASLVGSEMCIRDRGGMAVVGAALSPGVPGTTEALPSWPEPTLSLCSCLLYTSDAADDM